MNSFRASLPSPTLTIWGAPLGNWGFWMEENVANEVYA